VATVIYVIFTIALWSSTKKAADAALISANAAKESAEAATRSADIAAGVHRPFMGIAELRLKTDRTHPTWIIAWGVRNFGSLPAVQTHATLTVSVGPNHWEHVGALSAEVLPQGAIESLARVELFGAIHPSVLSGEWILVLNLRIAYASADGRKYVHSAEARYKNATGTFEVDNSQTELV